MIYYELIKFHRMQCAASNLDMHSVKLQLLARIIFTKKNSDERFHPQKMDDEDRCVTFEYQ